MMHLKSRFTALVLMVSSFLKMCQAGGGVFELQLLDYQITNNNNRCTGSCATYFRICVKEYQTVVDPAAPCLFGSRVTARFLGDSLDFSNFQNYSVPLRFPFSFNWPGDFSLIIEAWHTSNTTQLNSAGNKQLLSRLADHRSLSTSDSFRVETHRESDTGSSLRFQYRVRCEPNYFGADCSKYCKARHQVNHFVCDAAGNKVCDKGWQGPHCDQPVCRAGCLHGSCSEPFGCDCEMGWLGDECDKCQAYPGCKHGACHGKAFGCICDDGWGGLLCNQDLNYCTHHSPCENGATCTNTGNGYYTCTCQPGYTGSNCEQKIEDCDDEPCLNAGVCSMTPSNYTCACSEGFSGQHCQVTATTCQQSPCANQATCVPTSTGFRCLCPTGYTGHVCDQKADACAVDPCINGGKCVREGANGYKCTCPQGFDGPTCDHNVNDCSEFACLNGGTCLDQVNSFKCKCAQGWMGTLCQDNIDDCVQRPCANGGTCIDRDNGFKCLCRPGFRGNGCNIDIDECAERPCRNGGLCQDKIDSFVCTCPKCYSGHQCQIRDDDCLWQLPYSSNRTDQPQIHILHSAAPTVASHSVQQTLMVIGLPVLAFFALIVCVLTAVVIFLYRRAHCQTPGTSTQSTSVPNSANSLEDQQNTQNQQLAAVMAVNNNRKAIDNEYSECQQKFHSKLDKERYVAVRVASEDNFDSLPPSIRAPNSKPPPPPAFYQHEQRKQTAVQYGSQSSSASSVVEAPQCSHSHSLAHQASASLRVRLPDRPAPIHYHQQNRGQHRQSLEQHRQSTSSSSSSPTRQSVTSPMTETMSLTSPISGDEQILSVRGAGADTIVTNLSLRDQATNSAYRHEDDTRRHSSRSPPPAYSPPEGHLV